jgi:predicted HAD superfamily Cof-like phosphohydrolase
VSDDFCDVGEFHQKFELPHALRDVGPREVDTGLLEFRMKFLCEELQEFLEGVGLTFSMSVWDMIVSNSNWNREKSHAQMFDSLIDLVYIAHGTAHIMGYPWHVGWAAVQRANMAKVRSDSDRSDSDRGSSFDVVKPPGWVAPDIAGVLAVYGWEA